VEMLLLGTLLWTFRKAQERTLPVGPFPSHKFLWNKSKFPAKLSFTSTRAELGTEKGKRIKPRLLSS